MDVFPPRLGPVMAGPFVCFCAATGRARTRHAETRALVTRIVHCMPRLMTGALSRCYRMRRDSQRSAKKRPSAVRPRSKSMGGNSRRKNDRLGGHLKRGTAPHFFAQPRCGDEAASLPHSARFAPAQSTFLRGRSAALGDERLNEQNNSHDQSNRVLLLMCSSKPKQNRAPSDEFVHLN